MNGARRRVLVIGGYGVFGGRIARMLAGDDTFDVIIAGRSRDKAQAFAESLGGAAGCLSIDVGGDIGPALRASGAGLVIHAAGPFQEQEYTVARSCIDAGIDYIDLADGREFVRGFRTLDQNARAAGVLAVTGASSVPGLSGAVVDHLTHDLRRVDEIVIGITPGNRAPRGRAVIAATLAAAGRPMPHWAGGRLTSTHAWHGLHRRELRLPDGTSLGRRWFSSWDAPDNVLFPDRYDVRDTVQFHAGLELATLHLGLSGLSWIVRLGLLRTLSPVVPAAHRIADLLSPFGSDRGGMVVEVAGQDGDGAARRRRWTLIAESGEGPWIPAIPAVVLARKWGRGALDVTGATPCLDLFTLDEFEAATAGLDIRHATVELA